MHFKTAIITSLLATTLTSASAVAQAGATARGSILVAGSGSVTRFRDSDSDRRVLTVDINPRIGVFIVDGLAVTGNLQYDRTSTESVISSRWGVGPGLTYYFGNPASRLHPFLTGRSFFSWSSRRLTGSDTEGKHHDMVWLAGGGLVVMLVNHVGVSAEAFYEWSERDAEFWSTPLRTERYGVRFGVAAFLF